MAIMDKGKLGTRVARHITSTMCDLERWPGSHMCLHMRTLVAMGPFLPNRKETDGTHHPHIITPASQLFQFE